jgi:hypothetical protein
MSICRGTIATVVDCAHVGATCIKNNTTVACARPGDACSVYDDPRVDRCMDGSTVEVCIAGRKTPFSCASVGLRCIPPTDVRSSYCGQ